MTGNSDTSSVVTHTLMPPVFASKIRILPHSIHPRTVCIRVEIKGCVLQGKHANYVLYFVILLKIKMPEQFALNCGCRHCLI